MIGLSYSKASVILQTTLCGFEKDQCCHTLFFIFSKLRDLASKNILKYGLNKHFVIKDFY